MVHSTTNEDLVVKAGYSSVSVVFLDEDTLLYAFENSEIGLLHKHQLVCTIAVGNDGNTFTSLTRTPDNQFVSFRGRSPFAWYLVSIPALLSLVQQRSASNSQRPSTPLKITISDLLSSGIATTVTGVSELWAVAFCSTSQKCSTEESKGLVGGKSVAVYEAYSLEPRRVCRQRILCTQDSSSGIKAEAEPVCSFTVDADSSRFVDVVVNRCASLVAIRSFDGTVRLLGAQKLDLRCSFQHEGIFGASTFLTSNQLLCGIQDGTLLRYDLPNQVFLEQESQISSSALTPVTLTTDDAESDYRVAVAVSPDGEWVLSGNASMVVRLWRASDLRALQT